MPGRREDDARLVAIGSAPVAGRGQVSLHRWDGSTVGASLAEVPVDSPTWVQWTPEGRRLVVASEASPGRVLSFEVVEDDTGRPLLHPVADVPTGGSHPCHLAFTGDGSHVVVANYADGVVSLLEVEDGVPARLVDTVRLEGSGPDPARQEGSHPHHVAPLGARTISVVDLGSDRIQTFAVDDGRLREMARTDLPGGAGPRHLVRSSAPGPRAGSAPGMPATAYLTAELSGQVLRLAEEAPGRFAVVASAAASGRPGADDVAHLALDEESDRLWVSNRGPDTVSTFDVAGGGLRLLDEVDVPAHPRQFTVHGGRVLVGGLRGDAVSVHEFRPDGTLGPGRSAPVPAPACIAVGPRRA